MTAELLAEARALIERQADAAPRSMRVHILAGNIGDDRTRLLVHLTNALEAADAAFQQLHYSCDNPDHGGAYQALATALGYYTQEER